MKHMSRNQHLNITQDHIPKKKKHYKLTKIPMVSICSSPPRNTSSSFSKVYLNLDSSSLDSRPKKQLNNMVIDPISTQHLISHKQFSKQAAKFSHSFFAERTKSQMKFKRKFQNFGNDCRQRFNNL